MKCGAVDFLEKPFDDDVLLASVRAALNRSEESAAVEAERAEIRARIGALTQRERDVLEGLVAGHPNKIIAFKLEISPRTVENLSRQSDDQDEGGKPVGARSHGPRRRTGKIARSLISGCSRRPLVDRVDLRQGGYRATRP
jgi:FixJ family two-component response regulator